MYTSFVSLKFKLENRSTVVVKLIFTCAQDLHVDLSVLKPEVVCVLKRNAK